MASNIPIRCPRHRYRYRYRGLHRPGRGHRRCADCALGGSSAVRLGAGDEAVPCAPQWEWESDRRAC